MRPLTLTRLLLRCGILAAILFVVVVVALKLGAVQVSLYGLGKDLIDVLLRRANSLSSDYGLIVLDIRLPRILLALWLARPFRSPAPVFRRCFAIPWPTLMCSA